MIRVLMLVVPLALPPTALAQRYLGQLGGNPYNSNSTLNPYGGGNPYNSNSITNPYGRYGNPYSGSSATNPYTTNAPSLYDSQGNYRGKLSANRSVFHLESLRTLR